VPDWPDQPEYPEITPLAAAIDVKYPTFAEMKFAALIEPALMVVM